MAILTDLKARSIRPDDRPLPHGSITGLTLHPSTTKGHGKWVLRYVSPVTHSRRNAGLGAYPAVTIAEAAKKATLMREQIAQGEDPLEQKVAQTRAVIPTLADAATAVHAELKPGWKNPKHAQQWWNTIEQYALPIIGSMTLDQIQPRNIADVLRPIWLDIPETASRVKQRLHAVMAWGWAHGHCQANPVDVVTHLLPLQPGKAIRTHHQPAMPWRTLPAYVAEHLGAHKGHDVTRALLEFLILTAARSGEARGMTWQEVDFETKIWTVPAERMKAKMPHRVPLSVQALAILHGQQGRHDTLVFPSVRKCVELTDMVLTAFLRRTQAPSDTPGRLATAHGFRSTFRDWCSEQGYPRDLAERALAHTVQNKVEAAYHRTDLLEQRAPMMQAWAYYVCDVRSTENAQEPGTLAEMLKKHMSEKFRRSN